MAPQNILERFFSLITVTEKLASNENNNAPNKVVITANCIFPRAVKNPITEPKIAHHKIVK